MGNNTKGFWSPKIVQNFSYHVDNEDCASIEIDQHIFNKGIS